MHRGPFQTPQESSHDAAGAGPALSGRGLRGRARLHSGGGDPTATFLRCPPPTAIICLTSGTALALPPATCPCSSQACRLWSSRSAGRTSTWALWLGAPWPWAGTQESWALVSSLENGTALVLQTVSSRRAPVQVTFICKNRSPAAPFREQGLSPLLLVLTFTAHNEHAFSFPASFRSHFYTLCET